MPELVLGIANRTFRLDQEEIFRVYGENIADSDPHDTDPENDAFDLTVKLESTNFVWDPAEYIADPADRELFYVVVRSTPRVPVGGRRPAASTADRLKVTLVLDEGGPDQQRAEETYDVTFEP